MKLKKGDNVLVITGKDKGKEGKILKTLRADNKVIVEGANIMTKHVKPSGQNEKGEILKTEAPIHASNVMILDPKTNERTRIGHSINKDGKKIRVSKKTNEKLD